MAIYELNGGLKISDRHITAKAWDNYRRKLASISAKASELMQKYVWEHGYDVTDEMIAYAYSLTSVYGEAAAELACQMRDEMIAYWANGGLSGNAKRIDQAEPAEVPTIREVAKVLEGTTEAQAPGAVGRLVKRTAEDTTLKNAIKDGAEVAWVPSGDTCPYCISLASYGWVKASKKQLKDGHAKHVHSNCDCTYAIRYDSHTNVEGYDPDQYEKMLDDAWEGGMRGKINALRRQQYEQNAEKIREQKRIAYQRRKNDDSQS